MLFHDKIPDMKVLYEFNLGSDDEYDHDIFKQAKEMHFVLTEIMNLERKMRKHEENPTFQNFSDRMFEIFRESTLELN